MYPFAPVTKTDFLGDVDWAMVTSLKRLGLEYCSLIVISSFWDHDEIYTLFILCLRSLYVQLTLLNKG